MVNCRMELGCESSNITGNYHAYVQPISWRRGVGGGRGNEKVWDEGRGGGRANLDVFVDPDPICIMAPGMIVEE